MYNYSWGEMREKKKKKGIENVSKLIITMNSHVIYIFVDAVIAWPSFITQIPKKLFHDIIIKIKFYF